MTLIERLQEASEGSRELDQKVALAIGWTKKKWCSRNWLPPGGKNIDCRSNIPRYTTSIDAALTLLDEWWEYEITTLYGVAHVELPLNASGIDPQIGRRKDGDVPLALCIAALKAREQTQ